MVPSPDWGGTPLATDVSRWKSVHTVDPKPQRGDTLPFSRFAIRLSPLPGA